MELGRGWYEGPEADHLRQRELEDLAVTLFSEHREIGPSLSTLKSTVASFSYCPSTVEELSVRDFPPIAVDLAQQTRERATLESARSNVIGIREADGWASMPLVAALAELQRWVEQHNIDVDLTCGVSLAAFTREQLTRRMTQGVGKSLEELGAWRPESPARGRVPKS